MCHPWMIWERVNIARTVRAVFFRWTVNVRWNLWTLARVGTTRIIATLGFWNFESNTHLQATKILPGKHRKVHVFNATVAGFRGKGDGNEPIPRESKLTLWMMSKGCIITTWNARYFRFQYHSQKLIGSLWYMCHAMPCQILPNDPDWSPLKRSLTPPKRSLGRTWWLKKSHYTELGWWPAFHGKKTGSFRPWHIP